MEGFFVAVGQTTEPVVCMANIERGSSKGGKERALVQNDGEGQSHAWPT